MDFQCSNCCSNFNTSFFFLFFNKDKSGRSVASSAPVHSTVGRYYHSGKYFKYICQPDDLADEVPLIVQTDYNRRNKNTGPLFAPVPVPPVPARLAAPCPSPYNHIYQPQTLTAPRAVKHPPFVCSCNVFHGPQSGAWQPRTCYLGAKRKEWGVGGGAFCFLGVHNQRVVSNLPPPFFNFPFPLFRSNHCYHSGACFKRERSGRGLGEGGRERKREKGGGGVPWWNHL